MSWNTRWIRDPHGIQSRAKAAFIKRALGRGAVILLQETHWEVGRRGVWASVWALRRSRHLRTGNNADPPHH
eukprot:12927031-Prorocentrum_lima.AAC.1